MQKFSVPKLDGDFSGLEGKYLAANDGVPVEVCDDWKSLKDKRPDAMIFQVVDGKLEIQGPRLIIDGRLRCPRCKGHVAGMFQKYNGWVPYYKFGCMNCGLVAGKYEDCNGHLGD